MTRFWSAASSSSLGSRPCASGWPRPACADPFAKHWVDPSARRSYAVTNVSRDDLANGVANGVDGDFASDRSDPAMDADDEDPLVRRRRVEAVLLLAKSPLSPRKLAQMAHLSDATEARTHVRELGLVYQDLGRAMRIELIAGGYRMMTRSALAPWLSRLSHVPAPVRLSTPMMETLAIVAYRGPLARSGVEAVRGVACGELLRQLMERDLIRIAGRSEELGRPYLYGTTKRFLQLFGLVNSEALPPIQWQTLQDDNPEESSQENPSANSIPESPLPDESTSPSETCSPVESSSEQGSTSQVSNSSEEPVVSATVASEPSSEVNPNIDPIVAASQAASSILDWPAEEVPAATSATSSPTAVIEDEEDDLYEGVNDDDDDDDWDDDEDDWDDDDEEDEDDDDELDDDWEEVDDSDDDSDDDDDDDLDDDDLDDSDQADDDEDWSEDDDDDSDDDDDEEWD